MSDPFDGGGGTLAAILVMAAITVLLRLAGYFIIGRFALTPAVRRALEALPVAIFVASVVPLALRAGPAGWLATPVAALLMALTGIELVALAGAMAVAAAVRALGY